MSQKNPFLGRVIRRRRNQAGKPHAQTGVALIETLISILIFSFGVLGLIGLEASAINLSVDAEDRNRASLWANEMASFMWLQNSVNVSSAQQNLWHTNIATTTQSMGLPTGNFTIVPTAGTTNSADITITWIPLTDKAASTAQSTRQLTTRVILQ